MSILAGTFQLSLASAVQRASSLLNAFVLLRFLSVEQFGLLALATTFVSPLNLALTLGQTDLVVSRCSYLYGAGNPQKARALLGSFLLWFVTLALVAAALLLAVRPYVLARLPGLASFFVPTLAAGLVGSARNYIWVELQSEQRFGTLRQLEVVRHVALSLAYIGLVGVVGAGVQGALWAMAASGGVMLAGWLLTSPVGPPGSLAGFAPFGELIRSEGRHQVARYTLSSVQASGRPWLIRLLLGTEAVGMFQAAKSFVALPLDLVPLKEALMPISSHRASRADELGRMYRRSAKYGTWLYGGAAVTMIVFLPFVVPWLFPQYRSAVPVAQIMALTLLLGGISAPQDPLLYALPGQQPFYVLTLALRLAYMSSVGLLLMSILGVLGVAVGFVTEALLVAAIRHRRLAQLAPQLKIEWGKAFRLTEEDLAFGRSVWARWRSS